MNTVRTIYAIARYEAAVLFRSWFFRIFSGMSLGALVLIDIVLFGAWRDDVLRQSACALLDLLLFRSQGIHGFK